MLEHALESMASNMIDTIFSAVRKAQQLYTVSKGVVVAVVAPSSSYRGHSATRASFIIEGVADLHDPQPSVNAYLLSNSPGFQKIH